MIKLEVPSKIFSSLNNISALVTLCIALLAVSFAPIFIRLSETELGANGTVFNRMLIFVVVFGTLRGIRQSLIQEKDSPLFPPFLLQQWILLVVVGIISIISLGLWALSLEYTTVAKSMLLNNMTPAFTSFGAWLFLGKRFDGKFIAGVTIALCGAMVLGIEDLNSSEANLLGDIYALLSAVFLGAYFLVVEKLRDRFCATTILLWRCGIGSILLLPIVIFSEIKVFPTTLIAWLGVLGLGIISEGFGQRLLAYSMNNFSSSFVSVFLLLEPIISAILAWFIFAETLSPITWIGFVVILSGIYLAKSSNSSQQLH